MQAKISIIIPIYNVEKYLRQCLDSVVNQTLKDLEIICINDHSPDNSIIILKEYQQNDSRIKIISLPENKGLGHARNLGIKEATAEYTMFLDPDDWLELNACELLYNHIHTHKNDFVFFNYYNYYEASDTKTTDSKKYNVLLKQPTQNIKLAELTEPFKCSSESWFKIYNTNFLKAHNLKFSEHCHFEDQEFYMGTFIHATSVSVVNIPLYNYRKHQGSITTLNNNFQDLLDVRAITSKQITKNLPKMIYLSLLANQIASLLYWHKIYTKKNKRLRHSLYQDFRTLLLPYNMEDIRSIKHLINFKQYKDIIKHPTYTQYRLHKLLSKLFSIQRKYQNRLTISILGIKFSYKTHQKKNYRDKN